MQLCTTVPNGGRAGAVQIALRRYVEALGGELEVVAIIGNKRVKLLAV